MIHREWIYIPTTFPVGSSDRFGSSIACDPISVIVSEVMFSLADVTEEQLPNEASSVSRSAPPLDRLTSRISADTESFVLCAAELEEV